MISPRHPPQTQYPSSRKRATNGTEITNLLGHDPLIEQILGQPPHDLDLLLVSQARNGRLDDAPHTRLVDGDKTLIIHEGEEAHDELAIHAVGDAAVARDGLAEVFDFEGPFEAGGEEAAEGRDERGEGCEDENVELHGCDVEGEEAGREGQPGG